MLNCWALKRARTSWCRHSLLPLRVAGMDICFTHCSLSCTDSKRRQGEHLYGLLPKETSFKVSKSMCRHLAEAKDWVLALKAVIMCLFLVVIAPLDSTRLRGCKFFKSSSIDRVSLLVLPTMCYNLVGVRADKFTLQAVEVWGFVLLLPCWRKRENQIPGTTSFSYILQCYLLNISATFMFAFDTLSVKCKLLV